MFVLNPYQIKPNTIIGGVGSVITTKTALATKLGVSESIIQGFKIVGSDIHCKVSANYTIPNNCFLSDTTITKYEDLEGKCSALGQGCFEGTSAFTKAVFPNITTIPNRAFFNSNLNSIYCPLITSIVSNGLYSTNITELNTPLLETLGTQSLRDTLLLTSITANLTNIGGYALYDSYATPSLSGVSTITSSSFEGSKFINVSLPLINSIGSGATSVFRAMSLCTHISLPNLTSIGNSNLMFHALVSCLEIDMKKLKTYGTLASGGGTANTYGFASLKTGCVIKINEALATANSGNPHEAFVWVKDNRSAIVEFYDDSGNYVSTL